MRISLLAATVACGSLWTMNAHAVRYWSGECGEIYDACGPSSLPSGCDTVDTAFGALGNVGWTNQFLFAGPSAWPQDWMEASISGFDNIWMDKSNAAMAIWSGHGTSGPSEPDGAWALSFSDPHNGVCHAWAPSQIKFGERNGTGWANDSNNEFLIVDASCSMILGEVETVWENWGPGIMMGGQQVMAFMNSPEDRGDRVVEFADNVLYGDSNVSAWLDAGETCYAFWCFDSPIVLTHGSNQANANQRHANTSIWGSQFSAPGWGGWYLASWIDNGSC